MNTWEVLRRPIVTEKTTILSESRKYAFEVHKKATKPQIRRAVEAAFEVKVTGVNTQRVPGKTKTFGRRPVTSPSWKKAVVTLQEGDSIQLFEGA